MFDNIGRKIKTLAKVLCWLGIIGSIVSGIISVCMGKWIGEYLLQGILIMLVGSLASWISCFVLYGIGQLIENSDICIALLKEKLECEKSHCDTSKIQTQANDKWILLAIVSREQADQIFILFDANRVDYYKTDLGKVEIYVASVDFQRARALIAENFKDNPKVMKGLAPETPSDN